MRTIYILIFAWVMLSLPAHAQSSEAFLNELRENYVQALQNSDTEGILKVYSDNVMIHHIDGTMLKGADEVRDFYNKFFEENKARIRFENVSEDKLTDGLYFYHDKVFLDLESDEQTRRLEVVNIAKKIDGKWLVIKSYRWPMPK